MMTQHIARMLHLDPPTHYYRAFASFGICGGAGEHSLTPSCTTCKDMIGLEDTMERLAATDEMLIDHLTAKGVISRLPASPQCLDGSLEACVPSMPLVDVPRCVYCRREMR